MAKRFEREQVLGLTAVVRQIVVPYFKKIYTANSKLSEFLDILAPVQIGRREDAFRRASRFINNAALSGGVRATLATPRAEGSEICDL